MTTSAAAIGSDVGGTFTDLAAWDGTRLVTGKVATTPDDQSRAVIDGAIALGVDAQRLLHGTTVATNAVLERRGARTALITSEGFEDVLEIGRQDRPSLYDSFADRPEPIVSPDLRIGVADGAPLALGDLAGAEAVAISLLDGYRDAAAEGAVADAVRRAAPTAFVCRSSEVAPEFREFERASTTVLNAYVGPAVHRYLTALGARAADAGLPEGILVMRSSGGLMDVAEAADLAAAVLLSGPAGGVVAAAALGDALGLGSLVSFDMGGTSTDVCRIEGGTPEVLYERPVGGLPCRLPSVAIHAVGAGGGSLGWVDPGGSLRVGPESAGAVPGPASYGRGGVQPAVTDADVLLGRIDPEALLAGSLPLDVAAAQAALDRLGSEIGLSAVEAAEGVVAVVEEVMAGAVRKVSIEQGADPREASLVAFGGAGGLHAVPLAQRLGMAGVVIAPHAGVFSALGLLLSPPRVDVARGVLAGEGDLGLLSSRLAEVGADAIERLGAVAGAPEEVTTAVDVRYLGQAHEVTVECDAGSSWDAITGDFHRLHEQRNGFARQGDPVEVVAVRGVAVGRSVLRWDQIPAHTPTGPARLAEREIRSGGASVTAHRYRRPGCAPGDELTGPAIVEDTDATTYFPPGSRAVVHESGALEVEW